MENAAVNYAVAEAELWIFTQVFIYFSSIVKFIGFADASRGFCARRGCVEFECYCVVKRNV